MLVVGVALILALAGGAVAGSRGVLQSPRPTADCKEWRECRQLALAAVERGEYETFHDLAWRAVQTGPPKDPALMYLLARAQSLSGRPHDALVMLKRLAEMGVPSDAASNEDFRRVRQLPEWPDVEAQISALPSRESRTADRDTRPAGPSPTAPVAPPRPAPAPTAKPPAASSAAPPAAAAPAVPVTRLAPAAATIRFSATELSVSGLAYDATSARFVLADRAGRRLMVVDERLKNAMDLVRADAAGFLEISAMEIDAKRGDLWVASSSASSGAGALHRLQLLSGRPLRAFRAAADLEPVKLVDLAVAPTGTVLVLDATTPQLLVLRSGATALERLLRIDVREPVSVTVGKNDGIAFVAHGDGISRIDLRSRAASILTLPKGTSLGRLERIRSVGSSLVGVQVDADGARHVMRLELNARGNAITHVTSLEVAAPADAQTFVTTTGDELVYLTAGSGDTRGARGAEPSAANREFVAARVPLP